MDDLYLNWSKIDLVDLAQFFVFARSGFVVGGLWASEALRVLALCIEHACGSLKRVVGSCLIFSFSITQGKCAKLPTVIMSLSAIAELTEWAISEIALRV